jgi:hypothetical protein
MIMPFSLLTAAGFGAGLAYLFDPDRGSRRRSLVRDQLAHAWSKSARAADVTWRDASHRAYGSVAAVRSALAGEDGSSEVLIARVRSKMGRHVSHPSSIVVSASGGQVTLGGSILADEVHGLLSAVKSVKGVTGVDNQLEVHQSPENIPGLQGGVHRTGEPTEFMQVSWSPTARLLAGTTGCALMANCLTRRTPGAVLLGTLGFGLCLRAVANVEFARLFELGRRRRGIDRPVTQTRTRREGDSSVSVEKESSLTNSSK